jgi:tetratricopeptide (TPR) repeat protein
MRSCAVLKQADEAVYSGDFDQAAKLAGECINGGVAVVDALLIRARAEIEQGQFDAARSDIRAVMKIDSGNGDARKLVWKALLSEAQDALLMGQYDKAIKLTSEYISRGGPSTADALVLRAQGQLAQGESHGKFAPANLESARRDVQKALAVDPANSNANKLAEAIARKLIKNDQAPGVRP